MKNRLTCLIADDEPLARRLLRQFVSEEEQVDHVGECKDGEEVLDYFHQGRVDVLFLDIDMPKLSGISVLRKLENPPTVIITTAYEDHAVKAYELDVVDYLLKPFSQERFQQALRKAYAHKLSNKFGLSSIRDFVFIRTAYELKKFFLDEILFVEGMKEYVKIQPINDSHSYAYERMKEMEKKLGPSFVRAHKSFIVNLEKVESYQANSLNVAGVSIPVGRSYKKDLLQKLKQEA